MGDVVRVREEILGKAAILGVAAKLRLLRVVTASTA